ncbi:MAG TPA: PQQ-binding-like beta-propeller repeat protein [Verrucomicrobiae bacterium]|jgi:outer membrane protein assembly factor BamB
MQVRHLLIVTIIALTAASLSAEDWPEFRGPTGQGLSTSRGLPVEWSATKNVAWKVAVPGDGWSSPVIVNGRVYLTSAVSGSGALSLRVLCLNAADGKLIWNTEALAPADPGRKHNKNSHASPTPIIEGNRLYAHFGQHGTACLDLSGKVIWRTTELAYPPVHGNGGSPTLTAKALIFSCDGAQDPFVVALDKTSGKVLWKTSRETNAKRKFSFSTPLLITVSGKQQLISPGSGGVFAFDPDTGKEIWRVRYGEGYSVVPRPVFGHGLIFISTGFDQPNVLAIRPDGHGDVTETHIAWKLDKGAPKTPSLLLVGNELYMVADAGIATCVDAKTGTVHWSERVGGNYSSSPIFADGRIYFQNEEGGAVVIKPGKTFQKLAENSLGERSLASYAAADGALFIRTAAHLRRIQAKR